MSFDAPLRRVHPSLILKHSYKALLAVPIVLWFALSSDVGGSERIRLEPLGVAPTSRTLLLLGIALLILVRLFLAALFAYLSWRRLNYAITPDELIIEKGRLVRQARAIPFTQVQNIEVARGLFDRLFGTATVKVEVAGGLADEGTLEALPLAEVARLHASAGHPVPEAVRGRDGSAEPPLLIFGKRRLFVAGLFGWWVAGAALLLPVADRLLNWSSGDQDAQSLIGWVRSVAASIGTANTAAIILLLVLAAVLASAAASVVANYRFRVGLEGDALRLMRGLLSTREQLIPLGRVQSVRLSSLPVPGRQRWYKLEVTVQDSSKGDSRVVLAPLATIAELEPLLTLLGQPLPSEQGFRGCQSRYKMLRLVFINWEVFLLSSVPLAAIWFAKPNWFAWAVFVMALLWGKAVLSEALRWKNHAYRVEGETLVVRDGGLMSRTHRVPAARIQGRIIAQGPVERKLGLASVTFDVAGGGDSSRVAVCGLNLDDARELSHLIKQAVRSDTPGAAKKAA